MSLLPVGLQCTHRGHPLAASEYLMGLGASPMAGVLGNRVLLYVRAAVQRCWACKLTESVRLYS